MLNVFYVNISRMGISKGKIVIIAVIAFLTLTFFAIGYSAMEQVEANAPATEQRTGSEGQTDENVAVSAFKFV